ncbi:MAG: transporter substrate-binding domain-containing protein [Methylococcales bacterium]|nr:transporter substrate-binding domain-containing protein [Methylococcales bacterium]
MNRFISSTLLLLLLSISAFSHAEDKPLVVGSEQNYPPFALGSTAATADGFTVELWQAVAAESHLNSSIRVLPFHEILQEFKAGNIDVLINLAQSDERRQFADFTVPHVIVHGAVFVRTGERRIHSEADLNDKKIIVLNADLAHDYAVSRGWGNQLVLVDNAETGFQLLAAGQHDALLLSELTGKQTLEKLQLNNIDALPIKANFAQKFSFAVHKGNAELLAKINEGLALTKVSGVYDKLYEKWFGVYEEKALLPFLLKYLTPIISFFLLVMALIFYHRSVERKQAMQILKQNQRALAAAHADLLQFTYVAAHHLQEPTRRVVTFVQHLHTQLSDSPALNEEITSSLDFIQQSALRQRALVRDIQLYLSAIKPLSPPEQVSVRNTLAKILKHHAPLIRETHARIDYGDLPPVYIDPPRLYDIFNILLDNALHYRHPERALHIHISAERKAGRVYYRIADNGIGIPSDCHERVFLVFERLQVNSDPESTGIGLAIVQRIINSCGGTVSLSETPDGGTTVSFDLPE